MYTHFKRFYLFIRVYVFWHPLYIDVYIYIYIYIYVYVQRYAEAKVK
jgi:hypothetical protein